MGSIALTTLVFVFVPYQPLPIRTTHRLEISATNAEVKLKAIYSPDDNTIKRKEFSPGEGVELFAESGFRLPPNGNITYQRPQRGGLTLAFTIDSGPVTLRWDDQEQTLHPTHLYETGERRVDNWRISSDLETNTLEIELPGNTWGQPDPLWAVLGTLLPISDFFTASSILIVLSCLAIDLWGNKRITFPNAPLIKFWADALLCVGFAVVLIEIGFPDFIPVWFLLIFLPAVFYLLFHQAKYLIQEQGFLWPLFQGIQKIPEKMGAFFRRLNHNRWIFWIGAIAIAWIAVVAQQTLTRPGMGISGDSVHYLQGAENLASGKGYVIQIAEGDPEPITGFEPAYSTLLAVGIRLGMSVEGAARLLNAALIFLTILISGWLIFQITGKVLPALFGNLFLLMAPSILSIFAWVMSEPLFIVLLLAVFLSWFYYLKTPTLWRASLTGVISSLMIATRLAGVVFLPPLAIGMLTLKRLKFPDRLRDTVVFGLIALLAPAAFLIRNQILASSSSPSQGWTSVGFPQEYWEILGSEVSDWFKWGAFFNEGYQRFNAMFISLGFILILFIIWLIFRKRLSAKDPSDSLMVALFTSIPIYILAIVLNTIYLTPEQTTSGLSRYMIPIFVLAVIIIARLLSSYWQRPALFPKIFILFILLVSLQLYHHDYSNILEKQPLIYRQYTDRKNECGAKVIEIVQSFPDRSFYSNSCEYFYFLTDRPCRYLPYEKERYQPGGEIYEALKAGDWIVFTEEFGTDPPGVRSLIHNLTHFDSACYLDFYHWPEE